MFVNNVPCQCATDCTFEWSLDATPVILSLDTYQGNVGKFSAIFCREQNICDFLFSPSAHHPTSDKESTLKRKNLLPKSKFFSFRADPFKKGRQNKFDSCLS